MLPGLETLCIDSVFLTGLERLCDHQVFQFNPDVLKELIVETRIDWIQAMEEGLVDLLKRANHIRSLTLRLDKLTSGVSIPDDVIPDLESEIWEMMYDVPSLIRTGSVPLEHLSIDLTPWKDDTMEHIARHCPELVSLKVRAVHVNGTLSTRNHMPRLRRATFLSIQGPWFKNNIRATKMESEAEVVRECRAFWMGLEYLRLDPNYFWTYRGLEAARFQG
ncbi:hypothetical protein FRC00_008672 [Tulasnella sp. 408]|nr:hypothetical protein FRC00_008672 [Tulasnella sp. 408]